MNKWINKYSSTNKVWLLFLHGTENTKIFSQDLKWETKIPGTFF